MYHLFTVHGVMPSVVYNAPAGERTLINALFQIEIQKVKELEDK
jgi:hypothetical protein